MGKRHVTLGAKGAALFEACDFVIAQAKSILGV
jgi:hypothetical protein